MANQSGTDSTPGKGSYRTSGLVKQSRIHGVTFKDKLVTYADINGMAIFEGDIRLRTTQKRGIGRTGDSFRWPNGVIPYVIDKALPNKERVTEAIDHWHERTAIRLVERTDQDDYVSFQARDGCWSYVGRQGGMQELSLEDGCDRGSAIHEIGHAVGLWHEQSREDREEWVEIRWENIEDRYRHNFEQHITDGDDIGDYDFGSIMHYPDWAFTINGMSTIVPKKAGVIIGQREGLSEGDIAAVEQMYG